MSSGRSVWSLLFTNLRNAFKLRPEKGKLAGEDYLGNKYYEAPQNKNSYKKQPIRWYVPKENEDWQQNLPAEWEAWLRGRRKLAPTVEEVTRNLSVAMMKKEKGQEQKSQQEKAKSNEKSTSGFPKLPDYELDPGIHTKVKDKHNV